MGKDLDPATFVPTGTLVLEQTYQDYSLRIYQDPHSMFHQSFEILRGNLRIHAQAGGVFYYNDMSIDTPLRMGQDITGDGIPNLLITENSTGAHCCTCYYVFALGPRFRRIATIDAGHYDSRVTDVDGDGTLEFIVHDWAFRASGPWPECCKPDPYVILHYEDGAYHLAKDLMRKPAPTTGELEQLARKALQQYRPDWEASAEGIWDATLELIYSGHAESVEPFLDMIWPSDSEERRCFLQDLLDGIHCSLYWPEIKDLSTEWPWSEE
jgi:hypothetical protein